MARSGEAAGPRRTPARTPVKLGACASPLVTLGATTDTALPDDVLAAAQALLAQVDALPTLVDGGAPWFVERLAAPDFQVVVFGIGHVGHALVQVLGAVPCSVTWVDEREHDFPTTLPPNVTIVAADAPEAEVRAAAPGSMFRVMTHSHAFDFSLVATAGMIGSKSKRAQLERRLAAGGFSAEAIAQVSCPIGVAGINGREPGIIAVAVAAELVQAHERSAARAERRLRAKARSGVA